MNIDKDRLFDTTDTNNNLGPAVVAIAVSFVIFFVAIITSIHHLP